MFLVQFALFTYLLNVPIFLLKVAMVTSKLSILSADDKADLEKFLEEILNAYKKNNLKRRLANVCLGLLPAYAIYMNLVFIWCLLRVKTLNTYKAALLKRESFSFLPMFKYRVKESAE